MSISERVQKRATDLYTTAEPHVLNAYSKIDPYVPTVAKNAAILAGNTTVSVAKVGVSAASSAIDLSSRAVGTVVDINVKVAKAAGALAYNGAVGAKNVAVSAKDLGVKVVVGTVGYVRGTKKDEVEEEKEN